MEQVAVTYGLGELAHLSGTSERTIRFYQAEHLLPKPSKKGRDAVYSDDHRQRLVLIGELRERGLTLQTIRELMANERPARTVSEWLDIDATLSAPWSDDRPALVSQTELATIIGRSSASEIDLVAELQRAHYVQLQDDGRWLLPSPALLDHALRLRVAGIDIELSARMRDLLRRRLVKAVEDTVKLLVDRVGTGFAGAASLDEVATAVDALRPVAREMTSVILAQEVERALTGLVNAGPKSLLRSSHR